MVKKRDSGKKRKSEETGARDDEDDSLSNEKRILKGQITDLEDLISEIEFSLNLTKFGDIENLEVLNPPAVDQRRSYKLKNLDYILQHELYKFSGLYCTKFTKHEYIFNFSPFSSTKSDSLYTVQFFTDSGKGTMGRYIMPSSGMMENILADSPIDNVTGLILFFRNCKRHLDCYVDRKEQYEELRELTSTIKNFRVDSDTTHVLITCSFLQVYRKKSDSLIDMTVYLSYDYGKARPSTVNVDWSMKKRPSEEDTKGMRSFMKIFKTLRLVESYQHVENSSHNVFSWEPTDVEAGEILDLNDEPDESEEEVCRPRRQRGAARKRRRSPTPEVNEASGGDNSQEPEELHEEEKKPAKKKRRRKPKPKVQEASEEPTEDSRQEPEKSPEKVEKKPVKKKRGRKPKPKTQEASEKPAEEDSPQAPEKSPEKVQKKPVKKKREPKAKAKPVVQQKEERQTQKKSPEPFKKPRTRQSLLNFSRQPKDPENTTPTDKEHTSRTVSSTPMPKTRGKPRMNTPGDISPIVLQR
ncbi:uncharacterized protein LOC107038542 [Diachasma alloeum]|uniref:uncharacterized protein LOC107038542 n=1 Tax=Diachasma alloeum TaxID=454923 RepID=UPI000738502E|nr:uncharacterized protein LOC107038542 [Diachasma alloeum]XP_028981973.1 uncharacterized protein LOC107038542 [Diachasma alloeum]